MGKLQLQIEEVWRCTPWKKTMESAAFIPAGTVLGQCPLYAHVSTNPQQLIYFFAGAIVEGEDRNTSVGNEHDSNLAK